MSYGNISNKTLDKCPPHQSQNHIKNNNQTRKKTSLEKMAAKDRLKRHKQTERQTLK